MAELPNARIPELPPAAGINPDDLFPKYNSVTGLTEHVKASEFIGNESNAALYEWQSDYTYVLDEVSTYDGKWWQSLENDNTGNIPTEGVFWTQISKSASGFVPYAPGIFTDTNVYVLQTLDGYLQLFRLLDATRPFVSSNFSLEYAQGKWELMSERGYLGVNKTAHGFAVSDVLTFKSGAWNKFTTGDRVLGIVKQVVDVDHVIVLLTGSRVKGLTGLTAGATYYAQTNGTLGTTPTNGMVFVAISTTEAIILSGGGGPVIVQTTGSSTSDVMSQNAVTQAIQEAFLQIGDFAGDHDASGGLLPTTGTGTAGAIDSGDFWIVSVEGTITGLAPNADLKVGDLIFAKIDNAAVAADFLSVPSFGYKKIQNQAGTSLAQQQILQFGSGMTAQAGTGKTISKAGGNLSEDLIYDGVTAYGYALINLLYASISVDGNIDLNSNDGGEITIYTNDNAGSISTLQMTTTGLVLSTVRPGSQSTKIEFASDEIRFLIDNSLAAVFNTRGCFIAGGTSSSPAGTQNVTFGDTNENNGTFGSTIIGELSKIAASCGAALISGEYCYVGAYGARAMGRGARAMGIYSFAGGFDAVGGVSGETNTKAPQTNGTGAFGWYGTDGSQVANDGANGDYSAILGGVNSHVPSTSPRSVVLGGSGLKGRASDPDQVYVPKFNILTNPDLDNTLDEVMVRASNGQIKRRNLLIAPSTKTSSYVLALADERIEMNVASANTVTVPANATVAFPIGKKILVSQYGAGLTTIVAAAGVTIRSNSGTLASPGQYSDILLEKRATNEWYMWSAGGSVSAGDGLTKTGSTIKLGGPMAANVDIIGPGGITFGTATDPIGYYEVDIQGNGQYRIKNIGFAGTYEVEADEIYYSVYGVPMTLYARNYLGVGNPGGDLQIRQTQVVEGGGWVRSLFRQRAVETTDATPTVIAAASDLTGSPAVSFHGYVKGRRIGGSAGAANDCALYRVEGMLKSGTIAGTMVVTTLYEDQSGWNVVASGADISVVGAVNNTILWDINLYTESLPS